MTAASVMVLCCGFCYEQYCLSRRVHLVQPQGQLVDIGNRKLHLHVRGTGSPTIIFESGMGDGAAVWDDVVAGMSQKSTVVTYDRAGYGWSDPNPNADVHSIVDDLRTALDAQGITGPYLLVGHSIGGLYARAFYYHNSQEVVGIILVDSTHEDQFDRLPEPIKQRMEFMDAVLPVVRESARFGIPRLISGKGIHGPSYTSLDSYCREFENRVSIGRKMREMELPFDDLRMSVITAGELWQVPRDVSANEVKALWIEMHQEIASRSSDSVHQIVEDSGHHVLGDAPEKIRQEIEIMVDAIRSEGKLRDLRAGF